MDPQILETLVLILHVLASLAIIGLVLIQHGKGADAGSGFGGGSSGTVFGSGGAGNFLTKATTWLVIGFFITSFGLAYFAKQKSLAVRDMGLPQIEQSVEVNSELPALDALNADAELPSVESVDDELSSELPVADGSDVESAEENIQSKRSRKVKLGRSGEIGRHAILRGW